MKNAILSILVLIFMASEVCAAPSASFTTTGSTNNWNLDFSISNNLGGSNTIYFYGVNLPSSGISASPNGWDPNTWSTWNNSSNGGSNITYNNNWINFYSNIANGITMNGFDVHVTTSLAPTSVQWFTYAYHGVYSGSDTFSNTFNPGFEGIATNNSALVPTPIPAAAWLMGSGLVGLVGLWRKRKI
jgi:hypothetical protein